MNLHQLLELRSKLLQDFEKTFETMNFRSEEEKQKYYEAFMKGMTGFFNHSMHLILDQENELPKEKKKAA